MIKILGVTILGAAMCLTSYFFRVNFNLISLDVVFLAVLAAVMLYPMYYHESVNGVEGLVRDKSERGNMSAVRDKTRSSALAGDIELNINSASYVNTFDGHEALGKTMEGVICAVSMVVESRDPYTAGHQRRVAGLARAIAQEMGQTEWQVTGIYVAGLLHDVGKVAVPFEILSKPGKLNSYELNIIKCHSRTGYEILRKINFPWPVTTAILQHHERLDGSGYPDGLQGRAIIMEARVLGVADVVEAMSSHRPYRPALGLDKAMAEIMRGNGVLYDSEAAEACLRLLNYNNKEFERIMAGAANNEYTMEMVRM